MKYKLLKALSISAGYASSVRESSKEPLCPADCSLSIAGQQMVCTCSHIKHKQVCI